MADSVRRFAALGALYRGDNAGFFRACLLSLEAQTVQVPIYIVVDGPIGGELELIIDEYNYLDIQYLRRAKNEGLALALQSALEFLRGQYEYVIRFDADDVNAPERFERSIVFAEKTSCDLFSCQMREIDANGDVFSARVVPQSSQEIRRRQSFRNPFNHPGAVIRLEAALEAGGYKEMPFFEDWYLWDRMIKRGFRVANMPDFLVDFRATDAMVSRRYGAEYRSYESRFFWRRIQEGLGSPVAIAFAWFVRGVVKGFGYSVYKKIFFAVRR